MPLYEYKCKRCGQQFESYRRLSDVGKEEKCPACGGISEKVGLSIFAPKGSAPKGGSTCGGPSHRSPFR